MELLQTPNLLVQPATGAGQIAPTPKRNAILGAFVGLLLGLAIAFLWETLDKRVGPRRKSSDGSGCRASRGSRSRRAAQRRRAASRCSMIHRTPTPKRSDG